MSLNQLHVSSPPYVLDSALYPGLVEKKRVPESVSRGLNHQLIQTGIIPSTSVE